MIPDADADAETEGEIDLRKGRWGRFRFTDVKRAVVICRRLTDITWIQERMVV